MEIKVKTKFDEKIKDKEKQRQEYRDKYIMPIEKQIEQLKKERLKYIFENKKYKTFPLDKKYEGRDISSITFMTGKGEEYWLGNDEILDVVNGYPRYSSYSNGIIEFVNDGFYYYFYGNKSKMDLIGYIEIEFKEK